mgnify:CR=1 FL=1
MFCGETSIVPNRPAGWHAVTDALSALPLVDADRLGYWGLSMGTMFGLPFLAEEPRIRAAVLGLASLTGPSVDRSGIRPVFEANAPRIACPVLFVEGAQTLYFMFFDGKFSREEFLQRVALVPDFRLETIDQAAHMLHHDQPEALAAHLAGFLTP